MVHTKTTPPTFICGSNAFTDFAQLLNENFDSYLKILIVDVNTHRYCLPVLKQNIKGLAKAPIIKLPATEYAKSMESVSVIINKLIKLKAAKKTVIINLGGGVITDLGGFCASIYQRGIPCIQVPTSLVAMTDAAIGGKTGINFGQLKNYIGTFTHANATIIYPDFLKTLPPQQYLSGMAEVFKHGLIGDKKIYNQLLSTSWLQPISNQLLLQSIAVKQKIVHADFYEKNKRKLLNAGHTVGHAIESYSHTTGKPLLHGYCIAIGLIVECYIGHVLGLLSLKHLVEITHCIHQNFSFDPFTVKEVNQIIALMYFDKKNNNHQVNFSLVEKPGKAAVDCYASADVIKAGFMFFNAS
ncbi:MAG: 3-dehydroquinate synthase [Bacteroidia bacterium]|nr:3-dehydroquinate synthase [Bacteroidia bacterium]HQV01353.1 3-dehydroquinate synthase family protein [Bacteroidia bacterium]